MEENENKNELLLRDIVMTRNHTLSIDTVIICKILTLMAVTHSEELNAPGLPVNAIFCTTSFTKIHL